VKSTIKMMMMSGALLVIAMALLVFIPAGTLAYWQGWMYLGLIIVTSVISSAYLMRGDQSAIEHRQVKRETRPIQRIFAVTAHAWAVGMVVFSVIDHRFGWSHVPAAVSILGAILVATAAAAITVVVAQNNHAAFTVRVEEDQPLISTGLYGVVRHPMYTCNAVLMVGTPLALGSYWGLLFIIPGLLLFALRIRDEEALLRDELAGYDVYMQQVPHRLVPGVW
jgi:protein-S-isoprenylcysteine O-methyltransferase Ste14